MFAWWCENLSGAGAGVKVKAKVSQEKRSWRADELRGMDFSFHHHNSASIQENKARGYQMGR